MKTPASAGCNDSTDNEKGQATRYSAQPHITLNNTDKKEHRENLSASQASRRLFAPANLHLLVSHPATPLLVQRYGLSDTHARLIAALHWGER